MSAFDQDLPHTDVLCLYTTALREHLDKAGITAELISKTRCSIWQALHEEKVLAPPAWRGVFWVASPEPLLLACSQKRSAHLWTPVLRIRSCWTCSASG